MYEYFSDTDTLSIYLVNPTKGLIDNSDEVVPGLLVDYTADNKIVAMDIFDASNSTPAHFMDHAKIHEGKAPFHLQEDYDAEQQHFVVTLLDNPPKSSYVATDDERIRVGVTNNGQWTSIKILHATESISSPLVQCSG